MSSILEKGRLTAAVFAALLFAAPLTLQHFHLSEFRDDLFGLVTLSSHLMVLLKSG